MQSRLLYWFLAVGDTFSDQRSPLHAVSAWDKDSRFDTLVQDLVREPASVCCHVDSLVPIIEMPMDHGFVVD